MMIQTPFFGLEKRFFRCEFFWGYAKKKSMQNEPKKYPTLTATFIF